MKINFLHLLILLSFIGCNSQNSNETESDGQDTSTKAIDQTEIPVYANKEAFFGETHLHTGVSMDAFIGGNRLGAEDAYRFAMGEEMMVNGKLHKLKRPLDFCAVSDHAEFFGETYTLLNEGTPGYDNPIAKQMREADTYESAIELFVKYVITPARSGASMHPEFYQGPETTKANWRKNFEATEKYYQPGKFTTLHAFEWSAAPNAGNLHRNVIYRDTIVSDIPFSANDSRNPEDLWAWMQEQINDGSTLLAIPHNSNGSKGLMFPEVDLDGNPITEQYAQLRNEMEPLIEMMQIKGNSEVHPDFWKDDEFANFELAPSIQNFSGRSFDKQNFVRYGLERGLKYHTDLGTNPFKYGFIGGSDSHNGSPGNVEDDNYGVGSHGLADQTANDRLTREIDGWATAYDINPGSLAAVWAESNTREAIWDAMKRKETFATSGPRIKVRFFAGNYDEVPDDYDEFVQLGYANGVPMGGDLSVGNGESPSFLVRAIKDPMNANLDRVQIIKGWYENGEMKDKIYNVGVSDGRVIAEDGSVTPLDAPINLETGEYATDKGESEFNVHWVDPDFNPQIPCFYYVRVIMLPTARWTLWDEIREGIKYPEEVPKQITERAWTSPIWYTPK